MRERGVARGGHGGRRGQDGQGQEAWDPSVLKSHGGKMHGIGPAHAHSIEGALLLEKLQELKGVDVCLAGQSQGRED